jgi:hypothetical protein
MKSFLKFVPVMLCALAAAFVFSGCSSPRITETGRSAVEQMLLSGVVDLGIGNADFSEFSGKKAFIEYDYLAPQVDKPYVQGVFEKQLAKNGVIVSRDAKDSDILIQIICGVLATDTTKFTVGLPQLPIPVPDTSLNVAIPELPFFQKMTRSGYGKFGFNVLESKTRKPVKVMDNIMARTSYTNWFFLLIPFKSHDMQLNIQTGKETDIEFDMP